MAKKQAAAADAAKEEGTQGQGRAVVLPNGEKRIEFIRNRFYKEGASRSEIKNEINKMLEEAGQADQQIPYQIVFSATKEETDPRDKPKPEKAEGEAADKGSKK